MLQFNGIYQFSTELSKPEPNISDLPEIPVTEMQFGMPVEYVAKCGFFYLIKMYQWAPSTSAKRGFNQRLIGGFFNKKRGLWRENHQHLCDQYKERMESIPLTDDYQKQFKKFSRTVNAAAHVSLLGSLMGHAAANCTEL